MNSYKVVYSGAFTFPDTKDCPFCGERIKKVAIKCKHCFSFLDAKDKTVSIDQALSIQETSNISTNFAQKNSDLKVSNTVATANNVQLIQKLFDDLLESLSTARGHIQHKNINEKSIAIARASRIVIDLQGALNFDNGGELALNLNELYSYATRRLDHANAHNDVTVLTEIHGLMSEISDAWTRSQSQR